MAIIKKTVAMVIGALALLLVLGFSDADKYLLMPSFFDNHRVGVLSKGEVDEKRIYRTISRFNRNLSSAYLVLDASPLRSSPMAEDLRRSHIDELAFLRKIGRAMELTVTDVRIEEVRRLPNDLLSVRTTESVALRYLSDRDGTEIVSYPQTGYVMNYLLEPSRSGWKVMRAETVKVEKHGG